MKYTIFEQKFLGSNLKMYVRIYTKTNSDNYNEFINDNSYSIMGSAKTVKEAEKLIDALGGEMERI